MDGRGVSEVLILLKFAVLYFFICFVKLSVGSDVTPRYVNSVTSSISVLLTDTLGSFVRFGLMKKYGVAVFLVFRVRQDSLSHLV